jgi:outer membrane protein insertion porin family
VQLRFGKALSNYVKAQASLKVEESDIESITFFLNPALRGEFGKHTNISTRWSITRDTVDNPRNVTTGSRHTGTIEVAGLGGDFSYIKLEHDSEWFWPISENKKWVLSFRTREGWGTPYGGDERLPLSARFYAGGTHTIRGYDYRDVGPKESRFFFGLGKDFSVGGEMMYVYNVEMKYKMNDILRLYFFQDGGSVWADASGIDFGDMRYSVGLGLGFDVPFMGPIRVDYGFPINPDEDQGSGRLHLQAGFDF